MLIKCILYSFILSSVAQATSQNYTKLTVNRDAMVTILRPQFNFESVNEKISEFSNLDGVCVLYGKYSGVVGLTYAKFLSPNSILIDEKGQQKGVQRTPSRIIETITCDASNLHKAFVETEADEIVRNKDDISFTVLGPKIHGMKISSSSDRDTVCNSFGFSKAVDRTPRMDNFNFSDMAKLNADGFAVEKMDLSASIKPIKALACSH